APGVPCFFVVGTRPPPRSTLSPYTTLFRSSFRLRLKSPRAVGSKAGGSKSVLLLEEQHSPQKRPPQRPAFFSFSEWRDYLRANRSEEHTSELQSRENLVCRLLLEKKNHTHA